MKYTSTKEKLEMIAAMERFGGDFVKALAECFVRSDKENFQKLCDAFPEYVEEYSQKKWLDTD